MDSPQLFQAVILGIVEGLTEFLPVSSTGHLIIVGDFLGFTGEIAKTFEIFIQLGSVLGVVWLYRLKIWSVTSKLNELSAQRFLLNLGIAFLPAAIVGFITRPYKAPVQPGHVAGALIVEEPSSCSSSARITARGCELEAIRPSHALKIGLANGGDVSGVSRRTIMGGLLVGLAHHRDRVLFFLAMPTMLAATTYDLYKTYPLLRADDAIMLIIGFVTAFVTAIIVVKALLVYVSRHDFTAFGYYRIVFGLLVLLYYW
jgi:undecaprenyl-diphosphatase